MTTNWRVVQSLELDERAVIEDSDLISQCSNIAFYLPRNVDLEEVARLGLTVEDATGGTSEEIAVEEQWMGSRLKALVCYFGELAKWEEGKGWE